MNYPKLKITNKLYQLSNEDYFDLHPLLTPEEIEKEFAGRTKSARTIQRIYKNAGLKSSRQCYLELRNDSYAIADLEVDADTWMAHFEEQYEIERQKIKKRIWGRIRRVEDFYRNGDL